MVLSKFPVSPSYTVRNLIIPVSTWNYLFAGPSLSLFSKRASIPSLFCIMTWSKSISFSPTLKSYRRNLPLNAISVGAAEELFSMLSQTGNACFFSNFFCSFPRWETLYGNRYNAYLKPWHLPAPRALGLPTKSRMIRHNHRKLFEEEGRKDLVYFLSFLRHCL